jgi:hypothetical protein
MYAYCYVPCQQYWFEFQPEMAAILVIFCFY